MIYAVRSNRFCLHGPLHCCNSAVLLDRRTDEVSPIEDADAISASSPQVLAVVVSTGHQSVAIPKWICALVVENEIGRFQKAWPARLYYVWRSQECWQRLVAGSILALRINDYASRRAVNICCSGCTVYFSFASRHFPCIAFPIYFRSIFSILDPKALSCLLLHSGPDTVRINVATSCSLSRRVCVDSYAWHVRESTYAGRTEGDK